MMQPGLAYRYLNTPWAVSSDLYSAPGRLIVKLALGEAPNSIPSIRDVRRKLKPAATAMTVGSVDRILSHLTHRCTIACVHSPAISHMAHQHHATTLSHFDDVEHALGLSRTFRLHTDNETSVSELIDALRQLSVVEHAYPDYMTTLPFQQPAIGTYSTTLNPADDEAAWLPRNIVRAPQALAYEPGDPAVIVGIVDTGVAQMHPELLTRLRPGLDTVQISTTHLSAGVNLVGDGLTVDTDPEDEVGHGTACAAIIGARGTALPPGIAGECSLLPIRVLGAARFPGHKEPVGIGAISDIDQGMKYAVDLGAKVINMSFGTPEALIDPTDPQPHADTVKYALAHGCVLVAASGNSGKTERFSPASLEGVIAVGATDDTDQPTAFTTAGDHVALCAPGERVFSAGLQDFYRVTGTSFAAPFVAGAAALLVSRAARRSYPITSQEVRRILVSSAQPWRGQARESRGYGSGILDTYAALRLLDTEIDRMQQSDEAHIIGG